ncbi:MAG: succinylglutamate desuccinylase/aspartoacylase family protein [Pseudomonadota bacterium]
MRRFKFVRDIDPEIFEGDESQLLDALGGPACLLFSGKDTSRTRAVVTLLHGNEPSGLIALRRWGTRKETPETNLLFVLASVNAALEEPSFTHRMLPRARDLNRCFRPPFDDEQGHLAEEILTILDMHQPECIIDVHNTSGTSPAFAISTDLAPQTLALASLFTNRLLLMDITMGTLMEHTTAARPIVTIEVGGRSEQHAHDSAFAGFCKLSQASSILPNQSSELNEPGSDQYGREDAQGSGGSAVDLAVFRHPLRLELLDGVTVTYASEPRAGYDVTLMADLEQHNFAIVPKGTRLGWTQSQPVLLFRARDGGGRCALGAIVVKEQGWLKAARDLRLLMITNNAAIAESDCLFYAVAPDGSTISSLDACS